MDNICSVGCEFTGVVDEYPTDHELVGLAVYHARAMYSPRGTRHPRWLALMDAFGINQGKAFALCAKHAVDPYEILVS